MIGYYYVSGASGTARLGAACDFRIIGLQSVGEAFPQENRLVEWILEQGTGLLESDV